MNPDDPIAPPDPVALRRGDDAAWRTLVQRWDGPVRAYLHRLGSDSHEAEELAAEAFVKAWRARDAIADTNGISTWLFTIATNLWRNRRRWWTRRLRWILDTDVEPPLVRDPAPPPDDSAETDERAASVRRAVAKLPDHLRTPLVLARFEGRSQQEIAAILGCTPKVVEHRISNAIKLLRETLGPDIREQA